VFYHYLTKIGLNPISGEHRALWVNPCKHSILIRALLNSARAHSGTKFEDCA